MEICIAGNAKKAIAETNGGHAYSGDHGISIAGPNGYAESGVGGIVKVGPGGKICLSFVYYLRNGRKVIRKKITKKVGQDNIRPNVFYRLYPDKTKTIIGRNGVKFNPMKFFPVDGRKDYGS